MLLGISSSFSPRLLNSSAFRSQFRTVFSIPSFPPRTHYCGDLRSRHSSETVSLCGWIMRPRRISDSLLFVPIRDRQGVVQAVLTNEGGKNSALFSQLENLSAETIVNVVGKVQLRPESMWNNQLPTGQIEVEIQDLQILNPAESLPFPTSEKAKLANQSLRLKYRYLDLRRQQMYQNLKLRSDAAMITREYFLGNGFLEVETPTLFKHTPEGAREYIVPTRESNKFYALVQSPQQYKQLLMAGGIDRYFQIARCYRDEDLRADRQPEFTQIDLEMSFVTQPQVQAMIEGLVAKIWKGTKNVDLQLPFPRMDYRQAIAKFGSDKPDTRYDLFIENVTELFTSQPEGAKSEVFRKTLLQGGQIECLRVPNGSSTVAPKTLRQLEDLLSDFGLSKDNLRTAKVGDNWEWSKPLVAEHTALKLAINSAVKSQPGDLLVFLASVPLVNPGSTPMGKIRSFLATELQSAGHLTIPADQYNFLWVENFPLFSPVDQGQARKFDNTENVPLFEATHNPFTSPHPEDLPLLTTDPLKVRALHYDLVLNGSEIGGGSIRIHSAALQKYVLSEILRLPQEEIDRFQHLLDALSLGCPPHGGIALGFDRLMAILCQAESLRDVIAFPKSVAGNELMIGSPSTVSNQILKDYHLQVVASDDKKAGESGNQH